MDQNLNSYYIFYTVAKCKNISAASKELFISQPAISKSILKLEEDLHTTLFHRSSRGVTLTEAGEVLFTQLETAFHAIRQGEEQLIRMQNLGMGHLSIGASATLCKYVLLPVLSGFVNQNPHVEISVHCQSTAETMEALEKVRSISVSLVLRSKTMLSAIFKLWKYRTFLFPQQLIWKISENVPKKSIQIPLRCCRNLL